MSNQSGLNRLDVQQDVVEVLQAAGLENKTVAVSWRGHIPPHVTLHQLCTSLGQDNRYPKTKK